MLRIIRSSSRLLIPSSCYFTSSVRACGSSSHKSHDHNGTELPASGASLTGTKVHDIDRRSQEWEEPVPSSPIIDGDVAALTEPTSRPVDGFDGSVSRLTAILKHNANFVRNEGYKPLNVDPDLHVNMSRCVIVSCMDSRLTALLPAALGLRNGEAKFVKTAGAVVSHPFGSVMRSVLVALYELRASEVFVVGHTDCGMGGLDPDKTVRKMIQAGVPAERLTVLESAGVDVRSFLRGFQSLDASVIASADAVRKHPLVPPHVRVHSLIIDSNTGALRQAEREDRAKLFFNEREDRLTLGWQDGKPWG